VTKPYLHDLILELGQKEVDNLVLLDGQRVEVDLLHVLDLPGLDETAQLRDGLPLFLLVLTTTSAPSTAATAAAPVATTSEPAAAVTASSESATAGGATTSISHVDFAWEGCERSWGNLCVSDARERVRL